MILALSFIPASFVVLLVHEKGCRARHLQYSTGMQPLTFWIGNFLFDLISYSFSAVIVTAILMMFGLPAYSGRNLGAVFLLVLLHGWALTPLMYLVSRSFDVPTTAYVFLVLGNLVLGLTTTVSYALLDIFAVDGGALATVQTLLRVVSLLFPTFAFGQGTLGITKHEYKAQEQETLAALLGRPAPEFTSPAGSISANICMLLLEGFVYFALAVMYDPTNQSKPHKVLPCFKPNDDDEVPPPKQTGGGLSIQCDEPSVMAAELCNLPDDVREEATRVLRQEEQRKTFTWSGLAPGRTGSAVGADGSFSAGDEDDGVGGTGADAVEVHQLVHTYPKCGKPAVRGISFGARRGETFGLLGINGAGKSTTFNIMTGGIEASSGRVRVCGHNVQQQLQRARQHFGYCPQRDALFELLSVHEHLAFYGSVRGLDRAMLPRTIERLINYLGLTKWGDTQAWKLSGGNKRKLSVAIALLGSPTVLFLDEPTASVFLRAMGVD